MNRIVHRSYLALLVVAGCRGVVEEPISNAPGDGGTSNNSATSVVNPGASSSGNSYAGSGSSSATHGGSGDSGGSSLNSLPDAAMTSPLDATIASGGGGVVSQCVPELPIQFQDAGGCPTSPAGPVSPPSSASGSNVVGANGQVITIVDGYATIEEDESTGNLYTTYTSSLSFVFTDFANPLGYAVGSAVKENSRKAQIQGSGALQLTSSAGYPQFAPGSYSLGSGASETLYGFDSTCGTQSEPLLPATYNLTITAISNGRIQGSLTYPGSPLPDGGGPVAIHFDIPLAVLCGPFDAFNDLCCLP